MYQEMACSTHIRSFCGFTEERLNILLDNHFTLLTLGQILDRLGNMKTFNFEYADAEIILQESLHCMVAADSLPGRARTLQHIAKCSKVSSLFLVLLHEPASYYHQSSQTANNILIKTVKKNQNYFFVIARNVFQWACYFILVKFDCLHVHNIHLIL